MIKKFNHQKAEAYNINNNETEVKPIAGKNCVHRKQLGIINLTPSLKINIANIKHPSAPCTAKWKTSKLVG